MSQNTYKTKSITDDMRYAVYITADNEVGVTVFEKDETITMTLEKDLAVEFAEIIIRYSQLLTE